MDKFKNLIYANMMFFIGILSVVLLENILPSFMTFIPTSLQDIVWFGVLILYVLFMIVAPNVLIIMGLNEDNGGSAIISSIGSIVYSLLFIIGLYIGWGWISYYSTLLNSDLVYIIYWCGIVLCFLMNIIIVPIYTISSNNA